MFKKKKVKRSEWMEGLLWAEDALVYYYDVSKKMFVVDTDGMNAYEVLWRERERDDFRVVKLVSREYGQGVIDYIKYKEYLAVSK